MSNQRKHPQRRKGGRNLNYIRLPSDVKKEHEEQRIRDFQAQVERITQERMRELDERIRRSTLYRI